MEIPAFVKFFQEGLLLNTVLQVVSLSFNPIKLALLIGWVYLCLYFVQRVQFSPFVPKNYKSMANIATLFVGPILLFVLIIIYLIRSSLLGESGILRRLKEQIKNAATNIKATGFLGLQDESTLTLLNTSGAELKDIYGHGKNKRHDSHVLNLTKQIIVDALEQEASDILIDPKDESSYTIRLRVDGVLKTVEQMDTGTCKAVINSIKAISNMDISEKRRPQDGAFMAKTADSTISFRVATAGVLNGEKLSARILNQSAGRFTLYNIGMTAKQQAIIKNFINKPSGMILMCGPTGSGKTTTLYAMLNEIDRFTRNIITIEDPIEYVLENVSQIEINPKADITFAKSLRSILRQDPDVICVGEIRDEETAGIALRAAQTGHLVLATIHSNSNASALVRLMDLGVSPLLLSSGLNLILTQRLLRQLCRNCKIPAQLTQSQIHDFHKRKINYANMFQACGCEDCDGTGYRGRTAIYDMLDLDDRLKASITNNPTLLTELRREGDKKGKSNLQKQGLKAVTSSITSLKELKRVLG